MSLFVIVICIMVGSVGAVKITLIGLLGKKVIVDTDKPGRLCVVGLDIDGNDDFIYEFVPTGLSETEERDLTDFQKLMVEKNRAKVLSCFISKRDWLRAMEPSGDDVREQWLNDGLDLSRRKIARVYVYKRIKDNEFQLITLINAFVLKNRFGLVSVLPYHFGGEIFDYHNILGGLLLPRMGLARSRSEVDYSRSFDREGRFWLDGNELGVLLPNTPEMRIYRTMLGLDQLTDSDRAQLARLGWVAW